MKFSTVCRNRMRNTLISIITFALGLGLIASSHAQSYRSNADQEVTQTVATKESNGSREVDKGGHFAAWEQPQLFSEEIRAAFRSLR